MVEKNNILKLGRISDHAVISDERVAADKGTLANLRVFTDDCRSFDVNRIKNGCGFCNPDIFGALFILFRIKCRSQFQDKIMDLRKHLPRIDTALKYCRSDCFIQIKQIFNSAYLIFFHCFLLFSSLNAFRYSRCSSVSTAYSISLPN